MEAKHVEGLLAIEKALGPALCSDTNPCGAVVQYIAGDEKPWRIADDHTSEAFASLASALAAAGEWAEAYREAKATGTES